MFTKINSALSASYIQSASAAQETASDFSKDITVFTSTSEFRFMGSRHRILSFALLSSLLLFVCPLSLLAQSQTLRTTGVNLEEDKSGRAPTLTVTTRANTDGIEILADTFVDNSDHRVYPQRVEFYVNGSLFRTQIRSPRLPRPLGVTVGPDIAEVPFNYTVVASLVTPFGRSFSTVIEAAVFASQLTASLDCSLNRGAAESDDAQEFVANGVSVTQLSNALVSLSALFDQVAGSGEADVSGQFSIQDSSASGSISIAQDGQATQSVALSGTAEFDSNENLSGLDLISEDGLTSLVCS